MTRFDPLTWAAGAPRMERHLSAGEVALDVEVMDGFSPRLEEDGFLAFIMTWGTQVDTGVTVVYLAALYIYMYTGYHY
jgi:hypothetical protein